MKEMKKISILFLVGMLTLAFNSQQAFGAGSLQISVPNGHVYWNNGDFITTAFSPSDTITANFVTMNCLDDNNNDVGNETFEVAITTDSGGTNVIASAQISNNFQNTGGCDIHKYSFDFGDVALTGGTTYYLRTKVLAGAEVRAWNGAKLYYDGGLPAYDILTVAVPDGQLYWNNGDFITTAFSLSGDGTARFATMRCLDDNNNDAGNETFEVAITTDSGGTNVIASAQIANNFRNTGGCDEHLYLFDFLDTPLTGGTTYYLRTKVLAGAEVRSWNWSNNRNYLYYTGFHDVAVTNVTPCETAVRQGDCVCINDTVENQGDLTETFDVTTYYSMGTIPNGDFELDLVGTSYDDINDWDYNIVVHKGNPPTGDDLQIVDDYYFEGDKSVYSYLQTTSVAPFPGDSVVSQDLSTEQPVSTAADYITLLVGGDSYTTSSRYHWWIELILTDGNDTYAETLRCDCWGNNEGCNPNHYDYYDAIETGADGNTWKRYTRSIPDSLDKSNLTVTIRHRQATWDLTQANSRYRLDNIYFSDSEGNPLAPITIGTKPVTGLAPGGEITLTFAWNTKGVAPGYYTISAYAHPVPGETDTENNTYIDGTIGISPGAIPGDINEDSYVDFLDFAVLANNWLECNAPDDPNCTWEP